jgi:Mn2+/Fe2+ NRAMP family transporter
MKITDRETEVRLALVLGIVGVLATFSLPIVTVPIPILGLVLAIRGRHTSRRTSAIAAGVLCILALVLNMLLFLVLFVLSHLTP